MKVIYKYILDQTITDINIPKIAEIVSFQLQRGVPCLWAIVDTDLWLVRRQFQLCGTGHEIPKGKYIGTVMDGDLVLHAFEIDVAL